MKPENLIQVVIMSLIASILFLMCYYLGVTGGKIDAVTDKLEETNSLLAEIREFANTSVPRTCVIAGWYASPKGASSVKTVRVDEQGFLMSRSDYYPEKCVMMLTKEDGSIVPLLHAEKPPLQPIRKKGKKRGRKKLVDKNQLP